MEGEMCTTMCQIRPPQKVKRYTVTYMCDTKTLIEVSNRIRPTSDSRVWFDSGPMHDTQQCLGMNETAETMQTCVYVSSWC